VRSALKKSLILLALALAIAPLAVLAATDGKYLSPVGGEYETVALLSVGDSVPETSNPALDYQMVGIPDGLGAHPNNNGTATLFMNHEFTQGVMSEPLAGAPLNRGAIVSKFILDDDGTVLSGERAYDTVYQDDTLIGPAAQTDNATPGFGRFCSAFLGGPNEGLDRYIYFTNEEADGPGTFGPAGGQTVAVFDNEAHALSGLGRFAKENTVVMRGTGKWTVIISLEDGPSSPDSQLYMYVGRKQYGPGATVLERNGLVGGDLYVFAGLNKNKNSEATFTQGVTAGRWANIPNAENLDQTALEAVADAAGAFSFVRIEDGAFSKTSNEDLFFVTTGGNAAAGNELGRLYHLKLNPFVPWWPSVMKVVYNADAVIANGGDIAISPDNIDTSSRYLMVQEDGTTQSRAVMQAKGRDGGIWRFDLHNFFGTTFVNPLSAEFVAELDSPGDDGIPVPTPGTWESSGIISTSAIFGNDTWIADVQAHSPTTAPGVNTVEDGQLLLITPN
jgi:hypothetical protein